MEKAVFRSLTAGSCRRAFCQVPGAVGGQVFASNITAFAFALFGCWVPSDRYPHPRFDVHLAPTRAAGPTPGTSGTLREYCERSSALIGLFLTRRGYSEPLEDADNFGAGRGGEVVAI